MAPPTKTKRTKKVARRPKAKPVEEEPAPPAPGPDEEEPSGESYEPEQKGASKNYYRAALVSLGILTFICFFFLTELILSFYGISFMFGTVPGGLEPMFGRSSSLIIGFILMFSAIGMAFHLKDSKRNLKISFLPTGTLLGFTGLLIILDGSNEVPLAIIFAGLLVTILLDFYNVLNYPSVLEKVGRDRLLTHVEQEEREDKIRTWMLEEEEKVKQKETEIMGVRSELEEKSRQLMEEEESIRGLQNEIQNLRTEVKTQKEELMEEEENLRAKEQELTTMKVEMKEKEEHLMEEEERITAMEQSVSAAKLEVEKKQEEMMEEEERIKVKEEEAAKLTVDFEIKSRLLEEMAAKKQMMEEEVLQMKAELEVQIRKKIEDEEKLKIKKVASMVGTSGAKATRQVFPFTAIVGQEKMKLALILNAINPEIGGVLIQGQKGTGKSIAIRGLAEILPEISVVEGCRYNCDPSKPQDFCSDCKLRQEKKMLKTVSVQRRVVDLPLNTTEDRLVGSIDIEKVLSEGVRAFEPGLLAEAHRGILNVDEINLLDDYIVDILLDSAASAVVTVEREGVSISYPASFVIVGSMNPEEGELRPQLLDRLALSAWVGTLQSLGERVEIVRRLNEFSTSPKAFKERFMPEQEALKKRIQRARELVTRINVPKEMLTTIANLCLTFNVEGHRADIIIQRAAMANAAFQGRTNVTMEDLAVASELALPHRMKRKPMAKGETVESAIRRILEEQATA